MRSLLLTSLLFILAACSGSAPVSGPPVAPGPRVQIEAPPTGSLNDQQLVTIAADIHELEQNPLGLGAPEARAALVIWLTGSPDIHAMLCSGLTSDLTSSDSRYHSELLGHFILGMGSHLIENPEDEGNAAAISLGGMTGALSAYESFLAKDPSGKDRHMDRMMVRRNAGTLADYIAERTTGCS